MLAAGSPHPARPSLRHQPLRSPTTRAPRSLLAQRAGGAAPPEGVHLSTASPPAQRPAHPALEPPRRFPHGCGLCKEQTKAARVSGRRVPASAATEEHARNGLPRPAPVSWVAARGERQPWLDHGVCGQGAGPGGGGGGELTAGWSLRLRAHWELRQPARALRRTADAAEGERDPGGAVLNVRGQRPVLWKTRGRCPNLGESGGNAQISWTREKHCPRPSGHAAGPSVLGEQRESSQIRGAEAWEELRRRPRKAWNRCPLCTGLEEVRRAAGGPGAIAQISASTRQSSDLRAERMCVPK